jgi:hypothetical protein
MLGSLWLTFWLGNPTSSLLHPALGLMFGRYICFMSDLRTEFLLDMKECISFKYKKQKIMAVSLPVITAKRF